MIGCSAGLNGIVFNRGQRACKNLRATSLYSKKEISINVGVTPSSAVLRCAAAPVILALSGIFDRR